MLRMGGFVSVALVALACAPSPVAPPAQSPVAASSTAAPPEAPAPERTASKSEGPAVVAPTPTTCTDYVAVVNTAPASGTCPADQATRLLSLDDAMASSDAVTRDQKLYALESCPGFEPGLLRALRADLAPGECADSIVDPFLAGNRESVSLEISQVLRGLSLAARLMRTSDRPPLLLPPFTREKFQEFLDSSIRPWYKAQSKAVFDMASSGAKLSGYAKAIAAIEAGLSDLRFVENVRKVPLPAEMATDKEVSEVYAQALEDALDPRKIRGRDAILVGMLHLGQLGVTGDPRLSRARGQLSRLFSGSRIDALDALILPDLPPLSQATPSERLAAQLPSFYADRILRAEDLTSPTVVRALLERGLPPRLRQELDRISAKLPEVARLFARGELELGRRYFRPADFTRAAVLLDGKAPAAGATAKESRFIAALAHALEGGPENAVQLMLAGPMLPRGMGRVEALDRLTHDGGPMAGMAAFAAGHLLSIIPQDQPSPDHWLRVARYFDDAERKLTNPSHKATAHARAGDARSTAQQIREATKS